MIFIYCFLRTDLSRYIAGVDVKESKFSAAVSMGATECVNPLECEGKDVKKWLLSKEKWGYDYTFDCTGNVMVRGIVDL